MRRAFVADSELNARFDDGGRRLEAHVPLTFYSAEGPRHELEALRGHLLSLEKQRGVLAAYLRPPVRVMSLLDDVTERGSGLERGGSFRDHQGFLDGAPGLNVVAAHQQEWLGDGVTIADVEGAWLVEHEDLPHGQIAMLGASSLDGERNWLTHGTQVLGVLSAVHDARGMMGIAPRATVVLSPINATASNSSHAIVAATERLGPGDVLLIELQRAIDDATNPNDAPIAIEWWPCDHAAIRRAVNKGIVVVEAAGNGNAQLDSGRYARPEEGFPSGWQNPFESTHGGVHDSGAILVGAGVQSKGTSKLPDASRLPQSNHGRRVDVQAWGHGVATTGGGELVGAGTVAIPMTQWYTHRFSGTSAAAAIIAGVVACMQQCAKQVLRRPLTPHEARALLSNAHNGTPQRGNVERPISQHVGPRPDLAKIVEAIRAMTP